MATPHVAGAAALLFAQKPGLTVSVAKSLLLDGVDRPGQWTGLVASGGRLNVFGAALANAGDIPPTVSITAPLNSATLTVPPAITVTATASDSDGSVSLVAFYANGVLIGTAASGPYSVSWNPAANLHANRGCHRQRGCHHHVGCGGRRGHDDPPFRGGDDDARQLDRVIWWANAVLSTIRSAIPTRRLR
jgi:hypothetical protein